MNKAAKIRQCFDVRQKDFESVVLSDKKTKYHKPGSMNRKRVGNGNSNRARKY